MTPQKKRLEDWKSKIHMKNHFKKFLELTKQEGKRIAVLFIFIGFASWLSSLKKITIVSNWNN